MVKLSVISLGCDKNTVDSERMLGALVGFGAAFTRDPAEAEVIVVNTCGFIDAAKQESIETLLEAARFKEAGRCRALVAVGCLVEQYRDELARELPEVDLFLGLRDLDRLVPELRRRGFLDDPLKDHPGTRLPLGGPRHVSFLKVSEGCDHGCAFCAIPLWRGRHRSFPAEALVAEARGLEVRGVVELNLVAEDLTHWGRDLPGRPGLPELLEVLVRETSIPWFRLLYIYSAGLRGELVELIASEPRVLPYIDMPIQHASDRMLAAMRRPERADRLRETVKRLRGQIPELTLRTTAIVGFPGEEEDDFEALLDFVQEVQFDHLGAFAFSPQPGTAAAAMPNQLPEPVKMERLSRLQEVQNAVEAARNARSIGRVADVLVDRVDDGYGTGPCADGRTRGQAYEVDGVTHLTGLARLAPGSIVRAEVTGADDHDLWARVGEVVRPAPPAGDEAAATPLDLRSVWGR